jgi:FKBP-type peptidyl-prolyl cis-trans isomerase 2
MTEKIQKNDFIEIEYTGKLTDGEIFDTNIEEDAKKIGTKEKPKPFKMCVGHEMFLKKLDKEIEGKETGKTYSVQLKPKDAFGNRDPSLIRTYPLSAFTQREINPQPGMMLSLDNNLVKIISVSGGRVMVDFNNPLAGKEVIYEFRILKKITDLNEKIKSLSEFFYKQEFPFEVKENKLIIKAPKPAEKFILMFKDKFKEILNLDLEFIEQKKPEKFEEKSNNNKNTNLSH